jgi:hypothetical protein
MNTLRQWRINAEKRGYTRIAELCDYLQADELTHVKLATNWIRKLTEDRPEYREGLLQWSRAAVDKIESFYGAVYGSSEKAEPHFSFLRGGAEAGSGPPSKIIGE